jgi:hypothetical protein
LIGTPHTFEHELCFRVIVDKEKPFSWTTTTVEVHSRKGPESLWAVADVDFRQSMHSHLLVIRFVVPLRRCKAEMLVITVTYATDARSAAVSCAWYAIAPLAGC